MDLRAAPSDSGLRLNLLGGFSCTSNGRAVPGLAYDKMRALLAYLAVEPTRDHRRDVLAELLWSGSDPQTARGNLRRTLSDLRRVLEQPGGAALFAATKSTIRFLPNAVVDVVHFADATPAQDVDARSDDALGKVDLYAGEFMAGFHLPDCPLFEDWLLSWREALHRRALALLEQIGSLHEERGAPDKALPSALRWAELDPWNEAAHRRLMRLYAACGQRAAALRQFDVCRDLLHKELGVRLEPETEQLADRLREAAAAASAAPPAVAGAPALPHRPATSERRQATVLFCDLMLPGIDDLDDAIERLLSPRARCIECIERFSGFVVPMHGGGLLAYFGYPRSHEDSAVRAVRAALALLREAVDGVQIRVGVHTGLILTSEELSLPDTVGKTSGIAIQLRRCIDDGQVVVSEDTQRLAAGYFRFSSLGLRVLPDAARPLKVFSVDSDSGARTRLEAATRLVPLVGRVAELAQLAAVWNAAKHGAARAVLVRGDAAIGKSRLVHAFKRQLAGERHTLRELRCFPEYDRSPFHPLLALLEEDLGFLPGESPASKAAKLAAHLASVHPSCDQRMLPLLLSLYSLPPVAAAVPVAPQEQKRLILQFLREMLIPPAWPLPLLLVVEDLHWADPSTLELLSTLPERDPQAGVLLAIFTARPGVEPPGAASVLQLDPLPRRHIEALIRAVGGSLAAAWVQRIVERADGVPLFAEELAKSAALDDRAHIPATLRDMLAARMDALGEAKALIQLAATIGREFSLDLLRQAAGSEPTAFAQTLHGLMQTGLILAGLNDATCQFKHALIQEAAYESQNRSDRRRAHRQIATVLQGERADREKALPELVAQHLGAAGEVRQSIGFWIRAAHHATATSAHQEAIAHFEQALEALRTLPSGTERDREESSILLSLCPALHARHGYGSPEATRVTARIAVLRGQGLDVPDMFLVEWAGLRNTMARIGPGGVPEGATRLLALARDDRVKQQAAHYAAAVGCFWLGAFKVSGEHAATAMAGYRPDDHHPMLDLFDEDLSVSFAGHRAWALCFMGCPDQAIALSAGMIRQARAMRHPKTLAMALLFATMLHRWLNQYDETLVLSAETIALTREHGMVHWTATAELLLGKAQVMVEAKADLADLKVLVSQLEAAAPSYSPVRLVDVAELHLFLHRPGEALGLLAQSQAAESSTGTLQFAAERHRLEGECLLALAQPDTVAAEACFQRALVISRRQGARLLELRGAVSLARLWQRGGQRARARKLLEAVYACFTEGWEAPDLLAAAALLSSLD